MMYIILLVVSLHGICFAALPPQGSLLQKQENRSLNKEGSLTGGRAGWGYSLLDIKVQNIQNGERMILDIGDINGQSHKGLPAYFHLERTKSVLALDISQIVLSLVDEKDLQKLKKTRYFKNIQIQKDPYDGNINVQWKTSSELSVRAFQVPGKKYTSRIVVDILKN